MNRLIHGVSGTKLPRLLDPLHRQAREPVLDFFSSVSVHHVNFLWRQPARRVYDVRQQRLPADFVQYLG